jgi:2-methylcitrate dehydratase PrpD
MPAPSSALLRGVVDKESYRTLDDPALLDLARKIRLRADDALTAAYPARQGANVIVTLDDGRSIQQELADVAAAGEDLVRSRFRAAATSAVGAAQAARLEGVVDGLPGSRDAGALMRLARVGN